MDIKTHVLTFLVLIMVCPVLQGQETANLPESMGDYAGTFSDLKGDYELVARVIGSGGNEYRIQILPEFDKRAPLYLDILAKEENGRISGETDTWSFTIMKGIFQGKMRDNTESREFVLKKIFRKSPTTGLKAPEDAIVLFDGSGFDEWMHPGRPGELPVYNIIGNTMEINPGMERINGKRQKNDLLTKHSFSSIRLHMEFCLPYQPSQRNQGRGNSGIFLQDFYEVQILDSYGSEGAWNDCGALYKLAPPKVNASYPPGQWQTYDISYESPVYDASGKKLSNGFITVVHNGVTIHNHTELTHPTANSQLQRKMDHALLSPAPLRIQDHSNPVKFRNIWLQESKINDPK